MFNQRERQRVASGFKGSDPMSISKSQARSLAVEYHAYHDASAKDDYEGIICWGGLLLATQKATGVQIATPEYVEGRIDAAWCMLEVQKRS